MLRGSRMQMTLSSPALFLSLCVSSAYSLLPSERAASLPELTPAQKNKLRHLSIISLASNLKVSLQQL